MLSMTGTFPLVRQLDEMDCGPSCLMMIVQYFGKKLALDTARSLCDKGQQGVSLLGINRAAEEIGFNTLPLKISREVFFNEAKLPCLVHWQGMHYVVVYRITSKHVYIADPAQGKVKLPKNEFLCSWSTDNEAGIALMLQPTKRFYAQDHVSDKKENGLLSLLRETAKFKNMLAQLGAGALLGALLNLTFPFLTQMLVDQGIGNQDISLVYIVLAAQLVLFLSKTSVEFIRGWILAYLGTRINVSVVSEFLLKLTRLPLSFFSRRNLGDVLQRIADHKNIEEFLTSHTMTIVFSLVNLVVFSAIMIAYSWSIFVIFLCGSALSLFWATLFLNKRKTLDYRRFEAMRGNQNTLVQIIQGMSELKLNNCESSRRWEWENIQARLYQVRLKTLAVEQYQQGGTLFINEGKNILIMFVTATLVIEGQLSLGMMMAITYILGQMNAPIEQLLQFMRQAQDAKLSVERLNDIQSMPDEKQPQQFPLGDVTESGDIHIQDLRFAYSRHDAKPVLKDINLRIPANKTTAIVGASGSGKTTLLKLLLKFHQEYAGKISIGEQNLAFVEPGSWREKVGVVMQNGFIFSDSVAQNIAMDNDVPDMQRVILAAKTANINDDIESLPQGYLTKIGVEGIELSGGQAQRILIARAVYKNPSFIFFDEATSALDSNNEKAIQENLQLFFQGRTVVVVAHRLSTVKHADQIVVLDKGVVVETGNHSQLTQKQGHYYQLVKNQLEMGN